MTFRIPVPTLVSAASAWLVFATSATAEIWLSDGTRILEPADVLAEYVEEHDGRLWVNVPGRTSWELASPGAGDESPVHPMDGDVVADAWRDIAPAFTEHVPVTIVVLPMPRTLLPVSSAEDNLIYLSPGSAPYTERQIHFLLAHEMGHVVHRAFLETETDWALYQEIRNIGDPSVYHDWAAHANRPREIFAEDFRYLFGGAKANYSGTIENAAIAMPDDVPGLRAYFLSLVPAPPVAATVGHATPTLNLSPNPTRGATLISLAWPAGAPVELSTLRIVDVSGRVVLTRDVLSAAGGERHIRWDGRTDGGRPVGAGVYFAAVSGARGHAVSSRFVVVN